MNYAGELLGDLIEDLADEGYRILITRTDYGSFQLERYLYNKPEFTKELIMEFIEVHIINT
jgi:hypothetical protein